MSPFATALSSPLLLSNITRATSPAHGPIRGEKVGAKHSLAELAGTRDPISLRTPHIHRQPAPADVPPSRKTAGPEEAEFYWDSSGREWAPPNFPNHTNALLFVEYGKKKPTRISGSVFRRRGVGQFPRPSGRYRKKPPKNELGAVNGTGMREAWRFVEMLASRRSIGTSAIRLSSPFSAANSRASRP